MAIERVSGGSSLIDVLDRVLDKGIVIDAWVRISLIGIDLISEQARVVVASSETYLQYAGSGATSGAVSYSPLEGRNGKDVVAMKPRQARRRR